MNKVLRVLGLILVGGLLLVAIITSRNNGDSGPNTIWDERMTIGNLEAKNHFIIYSDLACPYCVAFENAIIEHQEQFEKYIEANDILIEVRLSDFLYEYGQSQSVESLYGAEAVYCARDEGRFWDYYDAAIVKVWDEYFSKGTASYTKFGELKEDYWIEIGKKVGLSEEFENCVKNDEKVEEIQAKALDTAKLVNGMPYFKFNKFESSGFDLAWGWDYVLMYFEAGLGRGE